MANKIQIRRGLKSKLPTLSSGELAYTTDTRETFVGTGSGNVNMGGSHWYRGTAMSGTVTTTGYYSYSACPQVKVDDIYLNTSNGNVYACTTAGSGTSAKWTYQGCIKGATGATGATGAKGANGVGIPQTMTAIEEDSDGYILISPPGGPNPDIGTYYFLNFSNLGENRGANGVNDIDGNTWFFRQSLRSTNSYIVELTSTGDCKVIATIANISYDNFLDYMIAKVSGMI